MLSDDDLLRYSRQILLRQIDIDGQLKIAAGRVLVVGLGGLGSPLALYLAAAGVGELHLADFDTVDLTNLQRQVLHDSASVGQAKVDSAMARLAALNPNVRLLPLRCALDADTLSAAVAAVDVVVDCCDNFATRAAVNAACVAAGRPLVSGAAIRLEGQLAVFDPRRADSPCYHCLYGEGGDVRCARAAWERGAWAVAMATPRGEVAMRLHIAGRHNVTNALAATACALAAGAPLAAIAQGLRDFTPVKGRSRAFSVSVAGRDITVVDDTYNANPDSMHAAIQVLAELPGPQLLVMGDMGEVGDQGPQFHAEAGALVREAGIPTMFALGAQSVHAVSAYGDGAGHFNDMSALQDAVRNVLPAVGSVLVKGSRFMKMEQVVEAISASVLPTEQQQKPINPREGHHGATH